MAPTPDGDRRALARCFGDGDGFERSWQRAPLVGRDHGGEGFADLLGLDAVDELITTRALRPPAFRLVRDGEPLPTAVAVTTRRWGTSRYDVAEPARVVAAVADGATLVLQSLHTHWLPLGRFCAALHEDLGHPTQANAYLTPADERGLGLHYDTHDVVVLQTAGRKRWEVLAPRFPLPLADQHWSDVGGGADLDDGDLEPVLSTVLEPGDCLYVPRGFVHRAESQGEPSLHVTVGIHAQTWHHLLRDLLGPAADLETVRAALPIGALRDGAPLDPAEADRLVKDLLGRVDLDERAAGLGQGAWAQYAGAHAGTLREALDPGPLDDDVVVARRPGRRRLVDEADGRCALVCPDRTIRFPVVARPALEALVNAPAPLAIGELAPHLDDTSRPVVVGRLLREGVLIRR